MASDWDIDPMDFEPPATAAPSGTMVEASHGPSVLSRGYDAKLSTLFGGGNATGGAGEQGGIDLQAELALGSGADAFVEACMVAGAAKLGRGTDALVANAAAQRQTLQADGKVFAYVGEKAAVAAAVGGGKEVAAGQDSVPFETWEQLASHTAETIRQAPPAPSGAGEAARRGLLEQLAATPELVGDLWKMTREGYRAASHMARAVQSATHKAYAETVAEVDMAEVAVTPQLRQAAVPKVGMM